MIDQFLCWLVSADRHLLTDNKADHRKFHLIGLSILGTWIFAMCVWAYFFSTVSTNILLILVGALLMGFIVLTIDRVLVAGIRNDTGQNNAGAIAFRVILALCLGAFMAQPALLYLFKKDIEVQLLADKEIKRQIFIGEIERSSNIQKEPLLAQLDSLNTVRSGLDSQVIRLRQSYLAEIDGTGGTGKIGIAKIANAKKSALDLATSQSELFKQQSSPILLNINAKVDSIQSVSAHKIKEFDAKEYSGFLSQIEALQHLIAENTALLWRYLLLLCILLLIELSPILSKLLLKTKVYNHRLMLEENRLLQLNQGYYEKELAEAEAFSANVHEHNLKSIEHLVSKVSNESKKDQFHPDFATGNNNKVQDWLHYYKGKKLGRYY